MLPHLTHFCGLRLHVGHIFAARIDDESRSAPHLTHLAMPFTSHPRAPSGMVPWSDRDCLGRAQSQPGATAISLPTSRWAA